MTNTSPITQAELAELARADQIDADRRRRYGRFIGCHGAADMDDEVILIRSKIRSAVYRRAGSATGLASYEGDYIRAGLRAVHAAGLR